MKAGFIESLAQARDPLLHGGKAANLARMLRAGLIVPSGVVLCVGTYHDHVARLGIAFQVESLAAALHTGDNAKVQQAASCLRQSLLNGDLDPELLNALRATIVDGARYAVRSSAPGEDGATASFAGQFDSVLDCTSVEEVAVAVRRVWASLFGDRALAYALHRKHFPPGMAVVLQRQVDARCSGVMFSRDPRPQYAECLLIEYCAGLGDRLVSGQVVPGRLRIDRVDGTVFIEQEADHSVAVDLASPDVISTFLKTARRLEGLFSSPLDVEWSMDAAGQMTLLQARPITAHAAPATVAVWTNANIAENFPEPVCPLLQSIVGRGYSAYFRSLGKAFGISKQRMTAMTDALDQIVGCHAGRLYYNLTNIHAVIRLAPGGSWLARFFNQFTGAEECPAPELPVQGKLRRGLEAMNVALHVVWRYLRVNRSLRAFEQEVDDYAAASNPVRLGRMDASELAGLMRRFMVIRCKRWTGAALADTSAMVCYGVLNLLLRYRRDVNVNDLLKGLPQLASAVPVERLWDLSRVLRADAALNALVKQESAEAIQERLSANEFPEFSKALKNYFDHWGFRYSGELMLSHPTPQEDPLPILRLLKRYAAMDGEGPAEISERQARSRVEATSKLRQSLRPVHAFGFGLVLKATQGAVRLRERARMKQALLYTRLRHVALALGDSLVRQGLLARRDDVLYLSIDESVGLADGTASQASCTGAMHEIVAVRRAEMAANLTQQPPDRFVMPAGALWQAADVVASSAELTDDDVLTGTGACGGHFCGAASVVLDVADIARIRADQVLVTRQTDPGWAAVFFMIKGLVIERGGMLSHGAIIAREYGIPAVVGVRDATRLIKDGQLLRVCGDEGRVERVHH